MTLQTAAMVRKQNNLDKLSKNISLGVSEDQCVLNPCDTSPANTNVACTVVSSVRQCTYTCSPTDYIPVSGGDAANGCDGKPFAVYSWSFIYSKIHTLRPMHCEPL